MNEGHSAFSGLERIRVLMEEHNLDFAPMLEIARSLREQIDWDYVRRRTADSPFARAFFELVDGLEIASSA